MLRYNRYNNIAKCASTFTVKSHLQRRVKIKNRIVAILAIAEVTINLKMRKFSFALLKILNDAMMY